MGTFGGLDERGFVGWNVGRDVGGDVGGLVGTFVGEGDGPFVWRLWKLLRGSFLSSLLGGVDGGGVDVGGAVGGWVGDNVGADEGVTVGRRLGPLVVK